MSKLNIIGLVICMLYGEIKDDFEVIFLLRNITHNTPLALCVCVMDKNEKVDF